MRHFVSVLAVAIALASSVPASAQDADVDAVFAKLVEERKADEAKARKPIADAVLAGDFAKAEVESARWLKALPGWKGDVSRKEAQRGVQLAVKTDIVDLVIAGKDDRSIPLLKGLADYSFTTEPEHDVRNAPPLMLAALLVASDYSDELKAQSPSDDALDALEVAYLRLVEKVQGPESSALIEMLADRAKRFAAKRRYVEAQPLFERVVALQVKADGENTVGTGNFLYELATNLERLGRLKEAEPYHRRVVAIREKNATADPVGLAVAQNNLAVNLDKQKRFAEGVPLYQAALANPKSYGDDQETLDSIRENAASNLDAQGRKSEAAAIRALVKRPASNVATGASALAVARQLAETRFNEGRFGEAVEAMQDVVAQLTAASDPDAPAATLRLAMFLGAAGRHEDALPLAESGLAATLKSFGEKSEQAAYAYHRLGEALLFLGRIDEARTARMKNVEILEGLYGKDSPELVASYNNLGTLVSGQASITEDKDERTPLLVEAEGWFRKALAAAGTTASLNNSGYLAAMGNLSDMLVKQGRAADAIPYIRKVVEAETTLYGPVNHDLAVSQLGLAEALLAVPASVAEGFGVAKAAVENLRLVSERSVDSSGRVSVHNHNGHYELLVEAGWSYQAAVPARAAEALDAAFGAAQDLSATASSAAMVQASIRAQAGNAPLAQLLREVETARDAVREAGAALQRSFAGTGAGDAAYASAQLKNEQAKLNALNARLDKEFPQYRALSSPRPLTVAEVQAALGPDEAVLLIVPVGEDLFSFGISKDKALWNKAEGLAPRAGVKLGTLRCSVDQATCSALTQVLGNIEQDTPMAKKGYRAFPLATAFELYSDFVAPVAGAFENAKKLYFATTGPLGDLPLSILLTDAPAPKADFADPAVLANAAWLGNRYAVTRLPSIAGLRLPVLTRSGGNGFAGYGSPVLDGDGLYPDRGGNGPLFTRSGEGLLADPGLLRTLSPLPGTKVELTAMATALGAPPNALRLGAAATETAVKSDTSLPTASIIAFATHGLLPGEALEDGEPGLVMTPPDEPTAMDDGMLTASEAATLKLSADWVILSACNTASGQGDQGGDSLSGLARGFLYAGARALLASHWRVSDEATAALTVETLAERKRNPALSRAQALQAAMRTVRTGVRADGSKLEGWTDAWAHPTNWAPFSHIANRDD